MQYLCQKLDLPKVRPRGVGRVCLYFYSLAFREGAFPETEFSRVPYSRKLGRELYINSTWTKRRQNAYVAQAIACSDNGNHATIHATGLTTDEANTKLMGALRELKLMPQPESGQPQKDLPEAAI